MTIVEVIEKICCGPAFCLRSIDLGGDFDFKIWFSLVAALLPCGAPQLTTAQLVWIKLPSMHHCLAAFQHLKSLRLVKVCVDEEGHASSGKDLGAKKSGNLFNLANYSIEVATSCQWLPTGQLDRESLCVTYCEILYCTFATRCCMFAIWG